MKDRIYASLPDFAQDWAISLYGRYWKKRRFGGKFQSYCQEFEKREFFTEKQWEEFQTKQLRSLLVHAFTKVPYYQRKYSKLGFSLKYLQNFELTNLEELPYLEKDDLRAFGKTDLLSLDYDKKGSFLNSSGSTGTPVSIYYSEKFHQKWFAACEVRMRKWAGITYDMPRGMIGGRQILGNAQKQKKYHRYNSAEKQVYFSAYHINAETAPLYLAAMIKYKVTYMTGYAVSNYVLAKFFKELKLKVPKLKAVLTSSEKLTPTMRSLLEEVYQCKVYDAYSGVEACGLIAESPEGYLLMSPDTGVMETIQIPDSSLDELVFTGLLNYDQPLIRYRIGDCAEVITERDSVGGRNMPIIKEIEGRVEDIVVAPNGSQMVRFHSLVYGINKVRLCQLEQLNKFEFILNYEADKPLNRKEEETIQTRLTYQLGGVNLSFNHTSKIPLTKNKKFKAVISRLNNDQITI